jgi:hypothetical protein
MLPKTHSEFTFGTIGDLLRLGARPTEPGPETGPDSDPQLPVPQPEEPLPFDPDPFPDYRDVPPMSPIDRVEA